MPICKRDSVKNDAVQIATSVMAFETEYGYLPGPNEGIVGGETLAALLGSNNRINPRQIIFLDVENAKKGKSGLQEELSWIAGAFPIASPSTATTTAPWSPVPTGSKYSRGWPSGAAPVRRTTGGPGNAITQHPGNSKPSTFSLRATRGNPLQQEDVNGDAFLVTRLSLVERLADRDDQANWRDFSRRIGSCFTVWRARRA